MKISANPIRMLYQILEEKPADGVAIISATDEIDRSRITVPYILEIYEDLDREIPGRSLSAEAADRFAAFIRSIPQTTQQVFCACNAGQCRSAAVAAAVHLYFGMDDMKIWEDPQYHPNPLVFSMLCESLHIPMTDAMLDYRLETNAQAFRKAIGK